MGSRAYSSLSEDLPLAKRARTSAPDASSALPDGVAASSPAGKSGQLRIVNPEALAGGCSPRASPGGRTPVPSFNGSPRPGPDGVMAPPAPRLPTVDAAMPPPTRAAAARRGRTALHDAVQGGDPSAFESALETTLASGDSEALDALDELGFSALTSAASAPDADAALRMTTRLLELGLRLDSTDLEGYTALHWAAALGHTRVVRALVAAGADANACATSGDTPLHRAARFGHAEVVDALLQMGACARKRNAEGVSAVGVASAAAGAAVRQAFFAADKRLRTLVLHHEDCMGHRTASAHQEAPERCSAILEKARALGEALHMTDRFAPASRAQLQAAHDARYVDFVFELHDKVARLGAPVPFTPRVQAMRGQPLKADLGCDTFFSAGSLPAARRAAGAVCNAVDRVVSGHSRNAFCVVRPPGHHAGVQGLLQDAVSCGFCIFNNVAVGALHALSTYPEVVRRVAIVDIDVHHGNGTEEIVRSLERRDDLLFFSVHLYDNPAQSVGSGEFYPGSGSEDSAPHGVLNAPITPLWRVPAGRTRKAKAAPAVAGRAAFRRAVAERLVPALDEFKPDLVLVSAGFDAGKGDIGCSKTEKGKTFSGIDLLPEDYTWVTQEIVAVAGRHCDDRVVSVLEGGYGHWARSKVPAAPGVPRKMVLNRDRLATNAMAHLKGLVAA